VLINQAAGIRNDPPTGFVSGIGADKLHHSPGDENNQCNYGYAGDEIDCSLVQRLGCETVNHLADDPGDQQLRADQTEHRQGGQDNQF